MFFRMPFSWTCLELQGDGSERFIRVKVNNTLCQVKLGSNDIGKIVLPSSACIDICTPIVRKQVVVLLRFRAVQLMKKKLKANCSLALGSSSDDWNGRGIPLFSKLDAKKLSESYLALFEEKSTWNYDISAHTNISLLTKEERGKAVYRNVERVDISLVIPTYGRPDFLIF